MALDMKVKLCDLCKKEESKYVCPRCGVPYCSVTCYKDEKKHLECSETFYKECVYNELKVQEGEKDPQTAKAMRDALQRFHQQYDQEDEVGDELDSDDDDPLDERLKGINLDDADQVWGQLTEEERNEFKRFAQSVSVQDVVPEWVPWWMEEPQKPKLVQELPDLKVEDATTPQGPESVTRKAHDKQPDSLDNIPPMSTLTKIKPNDHVKRGLTNVIASYAWTSRLYNGEFLTFDNPNEVAAALITLSSFLSKDMIFTTYEHALADVSLNACQIPELFDGGPTLQSHLHKDVFKILKGPSSSSFQFDSKSYILSALTECYQLISAVMKKSITKGSEDTLSPSFSKIFNNSSTNSISLDSKVLTKTKRKLHYLLAYANEYEVL